MNALPNWLVDILKAHRDAYSPIWRGFLSDHLPMAAMALWHVGVSKRDIQSWIARYQQQLEPMPSKSPHVDHPEGVWGSLDAYGGLLRFFDQELDQLGETAVLDRYLPSLISGWVSDAFHPLIRLSYGRRFGCSSEISAGLAYLTARGPNRQLEYVAQRATSGEVRWPGHVAIEGSTFDERVNQYLTLHTPEVRIPADPVAAYASDVLDILNTSHHFFALHLVTALHAFVTATRGLQGVGPDILAAGLTVGYAAAGFPPFEREASPTPFRTDFEHDVKLAFACDDYAKSSGNEKYRTAATVFGEALPSITDGIAQIPSAS